MTIQTREPNLLDGLLGKLAALPAAEKQRLADLAHKQLGAPAWVPNVGPQSAAYDSPADELFYGGAAGSGKSDLGIGLALTQHRRALILRRVNKDAVKLVERASAILGHRDGYNGQLQRWRLGEGDDARLIEFAGCEYEDDKQRFKGDPHDLIHFDEGTDFTYTQYRFIIGWNRSTVPGQRCRIVVASNPPTSPEGLWVIKHWGPWLDPMHARPAQPGELRWFTTSPDGADIEVDGPGPHLLGGEKVLARSRTFIPGKLADNPDLRETGYAAVLAGLPEELRRAYRDGDFSASIKDDEFQVIPTAWIEAAQKRWKPTPPRAHMTAVGLDVAQGGDAETVAAPRYGGWYDKLTCKPGKECQEGSDVAAMIVRVRRNNCPVIVDCGGGWGAAAVGAMERNGIPAVPYLGNKPSSGTSKDGKLKFYNKRAEDWWRFREELDPDQEFGSAIALPPGADAKADLAAPRWELTPRGIKVEAKPDIVKRLGRSPDKGDAIVLAMNEGGKAAAKHVREGRRGARPERANVGHSDFKKRLGQ
jgi:hypothetical protein